MIDKKMKAVVIDHYGDSSVMNIREVKIPTLAADEVLVKVHAASVNPIDIAIREGNLKRLISIKFPYIPGQDIAGTVEETGKNVTGFKKGDKVYAMLPTKRGGAYAEYVDVQEALLAHMPQNISFEEAASLPTAALAAYEGLIIKGNLRKDQDVLINGASGGVGTIAVQMAKAYEARKVTGVCSTKNIDLVKGLGADKVVDYTKNNFAEEDEIYEIVFDTVGNISFISARKILEPKGKFVSTIGSVSNILLDILSSLWTGRKCKFFFVKPGGKKLSEITKLVESNKIKPVIDKTYPLEKIIDAHNYSETKRTRGKIIIRLE